MHPSALYCVILFTLLSTSGLLAQQPAPAPLASIAPPTKTKDELATQIVPLRYGEVAKVVEHLRPLLPQTVTLSADERTNSIVLSDTQTNVRRIAQILTLIDEGMVTASSAAGTPAAPAPSGNENDVLRRMMERRNKELSKPSGNESDVFRRMMERRAKELSK